MKEIIKIKMEKGKKIAVDKIKYYYIVLVFLMLMTWLEYWQVTYIYRFILIYQGILIAMVYTLKDDVLVNPRGKIA